ncbi:MAG: adenosylcobinamide-phosphate synthase CbiB [Dehalococcoidia bacterium]
MKADAAIRGWVPHRVQILVAAIALDLIVGEPPAVVHPVVLIGKAIRALERRAPVRSSGAQFAYGLGMTVVVSGGASLAALALERSGRRSPLGFAASAIVLKSLFSVRMLLHATERVRRSLSDSDLEAARGATRWLVSRDTESLSGPLVAAAAIESLAENLTDSALAPWLAYAGFGLPGAAAYRALNTMDSMIGYRGRYEYLGKAAARGDDLANLIPARLGAAMIAAAAPLGPGSVGRSIATAREHHRRTESPNAGWTMSAMAGALRVQLEKAGAYRLGDGPPSAANDIRRAQRVAVGALALGAVVSVSVAWIMDRGLRGR